MTLFRNFTLVSTVLTYILIFIGGMVRVAGAGMGCPDWPKCFGRWIPPTSLDQLPNYIDPAKFNIVLAWIEYGNRLFGALVGLSISITLYLGLKYCSHLSRIKWPLISAFCLTLFQGWLGSVLVKKYHWQPIEAANFVDFVTPMLEIDPRNRAPAHICVRHP